MSAVGRVRSRGKELPHPAGGCYIHEAADRARRSVGASVIMSKLRLLSITLVVGQAILFAGRATATSPPFSGPVPSEVSRAFQTGAFSLPARPPADLGTSGTSANLTQWRVPVIVVAYSNYPLHYGKADLDRQLFDTGGNVPTGS